MEDGREWRLPSLLYADDLVLSSELEEDVMRWLAEVCSRKGLKVSAGNGTEWRGGIRVWFV